MKKNKRNKFDFQFLFDFVCKPEIYNEYNCIKDKNDTESFLIKNGWEYNNENGVWFKQGIKDKNGKWEFENKILNT